MKHLFTGLASFSLLLSLEAIAQNKPLYTSPEFSVFSDRVEQGKYVAKAISSTELTSNYQSPANASYSRVLVFKFSLNGKDDELPVGVNHEVCVRPKDGKFEMPIITFGQSEALKDEPTSSDYLEPNTKVLFRLDMREVLKSFSEKGFYQDLKGEKISKEDFKGVYIAGGSDPLSWDFENLMSKDRQLKDPDGDGIYTIELVFNAYNPDRFTAQSWKKTKDLSKFPQYKSDQVLVDALYNLTLEDVLLNSEADGTFRTGKEWSGVWTRDISYSIVLGIGALEPQRSIISLRKKVKRNRIIQDTGSGGSWPVSTDRTTWTLAAWELYCVTGDKSWLKESYEVIANTLNDDLKTIFSSDGLTMGESSFLDWRKQSYPRWMNNVDIFQSENLGTNAVHFAAYTIASKMAKLLGKESESAKFAGVAVNLKKAVNDHLWLANKGYYGQYRYGRINKTLSENSESLGEALSVLYDLAPSGRQASIIEKTPVVAWGTPCFYPQLPEIQPYHNNGVWPFVVGFWNMASARVENGASLEHGLAAMYRAAGMFLTNKENLVAQNGDYKTELNSDRQLWSVGASLGMIYKVFFGMHFTPDGVEFKPAVPKSFAGNRTLNNFTYRNSVLNISLSGFGTKIKSFKLDGKPQKSFIPGNLSGKHKIEILLADNDFTGDSKFNLVKNKFSPATPEVELKAGKLNWKPIDGVVKYEVFSNGKRINSITQTTFELPDINSTIEYAVRSIAADGTPSFLSEPILVYSPKDIIIVEAESSSAAETRKLSDYSGSGAVEISKTKNLELTFKANVQDEGDYWIDLRYSNGSGPVNTDNKCAIRTLLVNGTEQGSMVMAQRGVDEWSNWGFTNNRLVYLTKGINKISLRFLPENENMNVDVNTALIDYVRLLKQ